MRAADLAKRLVLLACAMLVAPCLLRADTRTWTDSTGSFRTVAELVDVNDGVVHLRKTDGKMISVPLDRLSTADQAFLKRGSGGTETPSSSTTDPLAPSTAKVLIELLTGATVEGKITGRDSQSVTIQVSLGSRTLTRTYPLDRIRAVTVDGKRVTINESASGGSSPSRTQSTTSKTKVLRTRAEIDRLIEEMGRTTPDWWDSTQLTYPKTLDLTWPQKAPPPWNPQKNIGQYLWDVIKPNSNKWEEGTRFMHFLLDRLGNDPEKRVRVMNELGSLYYLLLEDYARAAFWWRKAGVERGANTPQGVKLAECFFRLGNKQMALAFLRRNALYYHTIKALADMGETRTAIQLAEGAVRGGYPDMCYLYAGDACRIEGQYSQAIRYYKKVVDLKPQGKEVNRVKRSQERARANIEAIEIFDRLDLRRIANGRYRASAPGYAGDLEVEVTVQGGRIEDVKVTNHKEKQYYRAMTEMPRKIIQGQGVKGVDATTSATITAEAIINATASAEQGTLVVPGQAFNDMYGPGATAGLSSSAGSTGGQATPGTRQIGHDGPLEHVQPRSHLAIRKIP